MKSNRILTAVLLALLLVLAFAACASAAEIRPIPLDHDTLDLGNGEFRFFVRGGARAEEMGRFTAVLYKVDHYDGDQIRAMAPGDTVWADDRKWTVKEVVVHSLQETPDVPTDYEVYPEEDLGEEQYLAFRPCEDGTYIAVMGDWNPITLAGSVQVPLPLPEEFEYISADTKQGTEDFVADLATFDNPYNTECEFRDGLLIRVDSRDYPYGPQEPADDLPEISIQDGHTIIEDSRDLSRPVPIWKFCHGLRDGLDTATITAYTTDCEEGLIPAEITPEEEEMIRQLAINGTVTGKANDDSITGNTWVYTFTTPGGKQLLAIEMYQGLIVSSDGMYRYQK